MSKKKGIKVRRFATRQQIVAVKLSFDGDNASQIDRALFPESPEQWVNRVEGYQGLPEPRAVVWDIERSSWIPVVPGQWIARVDGTNQIQILSDEDLEQRYERIAA